MDKLNELAREAATTLLCCCADGEIKDKLIDATIIPLLPYLRRAYEMGRDARLANRVKTIQDIVDIANENEILRPVEPVEKSQTIEEGLVREIMRLGVRESMDALCDTDRTLETIREGITILHNYTEHRLEVRKICTDYQLAAKDAEIAALKEENEKLKDKLNNVWGDITNIWNNFIRRLESGGV